MSLTECPFESDLADTIHAARWPTGADPNLVRHVETCPVCQDVAAVLTAVLEVIDGREVEPSVPEAGAVWLRAQIRARAEAERTVTHPITVAQAVAIGGGTAIAGALFGATSTVFQRGVLGFLGQLKAWWATAAVPDVVTTTLASHLTVAVGLAVAIALAPVAAYLATRD